MDALTREPAVVKTRRRPRSWVIAVLLTIAVTAIAAAVWFLPARPDHRVAQNPAPAEPIPVIAAATEQKDMPLSLDALGTVQAFYTVTVKPMVDGPLLSVNFREGQDVHKGDVLAQPDPRTFQAALDQAVAKKAQDEAQLANARVDLVRYQRLIANDSASLQQAATQKALVAQLEAQVRQDQAQIDNARTLLGYCTITSPIDGRTGIRQIDPGNIVHAADATGLVVITQLQPISVLFTLPQQTLPAVANAMRNGSAKVFAYAQSASGSQAQLLDSGVLSVLDNQVDPTTGTIKLKATFPNSDRVLWPGGFVAVQLQVDTVRDALIVPPAAVQRGPAGPYVFAVQGASVKRQRVTLRHEDAHASIVSEGLRRGELVVIDGAARLSDGTKIRVVQPTGAPSEAQQPGSAQPRPPGAG